MLSRSIACRGAQRAARQHTAAIAQRRGLAAPASGSFQYQTGEAQGVKFASRDFAGPTTTLALVSKAGTRYDVVPGVAEGLANFAFRETTRRSTLRICREAELLGASLNAYHTRENLVLEAKFLRADLPYFVELLAEVASSSKFQPHVYDEEVLPLINMAHQRFIHDPAAMAVNSAHSLAFHRGLGASTVSASATPFTKYIDAHVLSHASKTAYAKNNFAVVANGADHGDFSKWVGQFFEGPFEGQTGARGKRSLYHGGEERLAHDGGNAMVLAFNGSTTFTGRAYKPEMAVLSALLGGEPAVKWSLGFNRMSIAKQGNTKVSTTNATYSDAGLLYITMSGPNADDVATTAFGAARAVSVMSTGGINSEQLAKAKAAAKFHELEKGQNIRAGLELTGNGLINDTKAYQMDEVAKAIDGVTEESIKAAAKSLLEQRVSVAAVGNLHVLPFASEIGLNV